jgi:3-hydroxyisobutyrate dehydrogenase-like beta-hydroxyacid dehydrogenase
MNLKDRIEDLASKCSVILSMLPNDAAVNQVSDLILKNSVADTVHISCSTVSPTTSRKLSEIYRSQGKEFIAAPVFARPDGLARRQAVWMVAGAERGRKLAAQLLESSGKVLF